jgi:iron uptake system EfeUOB component EfeO/EfeM
MKRNIFIALTILFVVPGLILAGCSGGDPEAKAKVDEALELVSSSQSLLEDLLSLDARINDLGTRFTDVEDSIAEGKSLAEMALVDVDELEARYAQAHDLFDEVANMEGAGDYAEYARLALAAVDKELEAISLNRLLLNNVWDMLDVLPLAESQEQLSYYVEEIDRLTAEINDLLQEGAEAAVVADRYFEEHGL